MSAFATNHKTNFATGQNIKSDSSIQSCYDAKQAPTRAAPESAEVEDIAAPKKQKSRCETKKAARNNVSNNTGPLCESLPTVFHASLDAQHHATGPPSTPMP
jgi:hypothetical protein